jgi:hypothetical protein
MCVARTFLVRSITLHQRAVCGRIHVLARPQAVPRVLQVLAHLLALRLRQRRAVHLGKRHGRLSVLRFPDVHREAVLVK